MKRALAAIFFLCATSGCQSDRHSEVASQGQSGGVTASKIDTVNQMVPTPVPSPFLKPLQAFYAYGGILARQWNPMPISVSDHDIELLDQRSSDWVNNTYGWLAKNVTAAAAERFALQTPQFGTYSLQGVKLSAQSQQKVDKWVKAMPQYLSNLDALMRSDAMYPQK